MAGAHSRHVGAQAALRVHARPRGVEGRSAMTRAILFAVSVVALTATDTAAQSPIARPLSPADTLAARDIGEITVAPDSRAILFIVNHANVSANRTDAALMLLHSSQSAPIALTIPASSPTTIRWAPD